MDVCFLITNFVWDILTKLVESRDPTLDDDNKSDSDEYEYEEIEIEYEELVSDVEPLRVTISEGFLHLPQFFSYLIIINWDFLVETITPKDENVKQKTLILKSDGTTEKLEKERKKSKVGRMLTSQEESILLPLIQGLLASGLNGSNETSEKSKHENTPFPEKENTNSPKDEDADNTCQEDATKSMYTYAITILISKQMINPTDLHNNISI